MIAALPAALSLAAAPPSAAPTIAADTPGAAPFDTVLAALVAPAPVTPAVAAAAPALEVLVQAVPSAASPVVYGEDSVTASDTAGDSDTGDTEDTDGTEPRDGMGVDPASVSIVPLTTVPLANVPLPPAPQPGADRPLPFAATGAIGSAAAPARAAPAASSGPAQAATSPVADTPDGADLPVIGTGGNRDMSSPNGTASPAYGSAPFAGGSMSASPVAPQPAPTSPVQDSEPRVTSPAPAAVLMASAAMPAPSPALPAVAEAVSVSAGPAVSADGPTRGIALPAGWSAAAAPITPNPLPDAAGEDQAAVPAMAPPALAGGYALRRAPVTLPGSFDATTEASGAAMAPGRKAATDAVPGLAAVDTGATIDRAPETMKAAPAPAQVGAVASAATDPASAIDLDAIFPAGADAPLTVAFMRPPAAMPAPPVVTAPVAAAPASATPAVANDVPREVAIGDAAPIAGADAAPAILPQPAATVAPADPAAASTASAAPAGEVSIRHHLDVAHDGVWLDRLAHDIAASADRDRTMRFQLNPERLGSLHVEIANLADGASVRFTADSEAARSLIADAQPRLVAEARAQGMRIADTQVDLSSSASQSGGQFGGQFGGQSGGAGAQASFAQQQQSGGQRAPFFDRPGTAMARPATATAAGSPRAERYA